MKVFTLALFSFVLSASAFAKNLHCQAGDAGNHNPVQVPVTLVSGAMLVDPIVTEYQSYKLSVVYNTGDEFEPQTWLSINANEISSQTYNVSEQGLYHLKAPSLFFQCWFE